MKKKTSVEILSSKHFYPAEDYHQKYYLQQSRELMQALGSIYPNIGDLIRSTAAARLSAFQAGYLSLPKLRAELAKLDLIPTSLENIIEIASGSTPAAAR